MASIADLRKSDDSSSKKSSKISLGFADLASDAAKKYKEYITLTNYAFSLKPEDWYKVFPYEFVVEDIEEGEKYIYALPIPPESLTLSMVSTSNLTPTIGGVVEETSETVFWQVNLTGTTGISPSRQVTDKVVSGTEGFRQSFNTGGILGKLVGSFLGGFNSLAQRTDTLFSIGKNFGPGSDTEPAAFNKLSGAIENQPAFSRSAINGDPLKSNGYTEIHQLHMFLNIYAKLKDSEQSRYRLYFKNNKDNIRWGAIVKSFSIQKSVNQPFLYKYSISLQCFEMQDATLSGRTPAVDRFGKDGDLATANSLTATGAITKASSLVKGIRQFKASGGASVVKLPGVT